MEGPPAAAVCNGNIQKGCSVPLRSAPSLVRTRTRSHGSPVGLQALGPCCHSGPQLPTALTPGGSPGGVTAGPGTGVQRDFHHTVTACEGAGRASSPQEHPLSPQALPRNWVLTRGNPDVPANKGSRHLREPAHQLPSENETWGRRAGSRDSPVEGVRLCGACRDWEGLRCLWAHPPKWPALRESWVDKGSRPRLLPSPPRAPLPGQQASKR